MMGYCGAKGATTYSYWQRVFLLLLVVVLHSSVVECCEEEERLALLQIKDYMLSYAVPKYNYGVNPWTLESSGERYDCCKWSEVRCNMSTGRVTKLILDSKVVRDNEDAWLFNVTLFHPFSQLISLDLSNNSINGLVEDHGSTKISTLKNLRVLNLDFNNLGSGHISVTDLTSLRTLSLSNASLNESTFPLYQELPNLWKLQVLDLTSNYFFGDIQGSWLCRLRDLRELYLSFNKFKGGIPPCINNLTSLHNLFLNDNNFSKELPDLSNLKSLQNLYLSDNNFEGKFSLNSLANHSKLQFLWLSGNKLQVETEDALWTPTFQLLSLELSDCRLNEPLGTIPKFLSYQYNLRYIELSDNNLVGFFPNWLLINNSLLLYLNLDNNSLIGNLQLPHHTKQLFKLTALSFSNNKLCGELPKTIGWMPNLELLDMSHNKLSGELTSGLLSNISSLEYLDLSYNSLQGDVIPNHMNLPNLSWLKLNNNNFGGKITEALKCSSSLQVFDISNNKVSGRLPYWIGNFSALTVLSVSNNLLQGQIPTKLNRLRLNYLDLSDNNFTGNIPSFYHNHSTLKYLHLRNSNLMGSMSDMLPDFSQLITLDLADNRLTGNIPWWISKFPNLRVLQLGGNRLQGQLPLHLCELANIDILDISHNNLSGAVPPCFVNMSFGKRSITSYPSDSIIQEEVIVLVKNTYLTYTGGNKLIMSALDLSCNKLTGLIPSQLGELEHIHSFNLSYNNLSGPIPSSFSNLQKIESLDISFNFLSGSIQSQLVELNTLEIFNVSYNNLTGRVPVTGQFGSFDERNYLGNPGLFGFLGSDLHNQTQALIPSNNIKDEGDEYHDGTFAVDFLWSFGMSCATIFLATITILYINPRWRQACFGFIDWYILWWLPMSWRSLY